MTTKQLAILAFIMQERAEGRSPSYRDVQRRFQIGISAVLNHVLSLRRLGLLGWEHGKARTFTPTCVFIPASEL